MSDDVVRIGKVVDIGGGQPFLDGPDPHVVEIATEMPEMAKSGHIRSIAVQMVLANGFLALRDVMGHAQGVKLLGAVTAHQHQLAARWLEQ